MSGDEVPNGGDPAVINDVGNNMMTYSQRLMEATARVGEYAAMPEASLGRAGEGVGLPPVFDESVESIVESVEFLATTLEDDGYYLQRVAAEIRDAMNTGGGM